MKNYYLDFPLLERKYKERKLIYFDNAATTPKPRAVLDAQSDYYLHHNANINRGPNFLSDEATILYEGARTELASFINAEREEIVFTAGATAGINLVARSWGEAILKKGDVIALSRAEHHANLVPWLQLKDKLGIEIQYIDLDADGSFDNESLEQVFANPNLRLLAITQASNVIGRYYDLKPIMQRARALNVITLVDAAQSIVHRRLDVKTLACDFLVFSGHKLFAPAGTGVLYGRAEILKNMPSFLGGGGMISEVSFASFTVYDIPTKFEAGTPNIEGVIALGAACRYLNELGREELEACENELTAYFIKRLSEFEYIKLVGGLTNRLPLFCLIIEGVHPHDVSDLLGEQGIIVRAGRHCAHPLHDYLHIDATLRASLAFYNTKEGIDEFFTLIGKIRQSMKG
ncbi:MAG: SufS family cysteine desulfurase [bacterium]|nr:SufS family cysteine desulfurase [bacterium]